MPLNTCPDCGNQVSSEAANCPNCGKPLNKTSEAQGSKPESNNEPPPKTWLIESILTTIFCCLPFGIVGIVYAAKVESNWYAGRREIALNASKNAKTWTLAALFSGIAVAILYIIFVVIIGIGAASLGY